MSIATPQPPPGVELGAQKINMFKVLWSTEMANYIQFRSQRCQKYASQEKSFK